MAEKIVRTVDFLWQNGLNYKQKKTTPPQHKNLEDRIWKRTSAWISLLDEDGKEHEFEIVDALELEEKQYLALVPLYDESQAEEALEDSGELVILRVSEEEDEDGEQYLDAIDNEEEYNRVAELFMGRLEDYFDFEDGEAAE